MGIFDTDIGEVQWDTSGDTAHLNIINRSILIEKNALYQPSGDKVAFITDKSGTRQIWLSEQTNGVTRQLSHLLADKSDVEAFIWSQDGNLIVYTARRQLQLLNLDGQTQSLATPFKVLEI